MDIETLKAELARDEGLRFHAYKDSEGYWSIGYGRLIDGRLGGGISLDEAKYLLHNDVTRTLMELDNAFPWWRGLKEPARRALANQAFNLGLPRLTGFKNMLAALEAHDYARAAEEALDSEWADQVKGRADRIANLYRSA